MMKVSRSNCVSLLIALGYAAADKLTDKEVLSKVNALPDIVDDEQDVEGVEKNPKMKKLLKAVLKCHADGNTVALPDGEATPATPKKKKKKKAAVKAEPTSPMVEGTKKKKKKKKAAAPVVATPKKKKKKVAAKPEPEPPTKKKTKKKVAKTPKAKTKDTVRIMSAVHVLEKVGKKKVPLSTLINAADEYHEKHGGGSNFGSAANELKKAVKVMAHLEILDWDGEKVWKL